VKTIHVPKIPIETERQFCHMLRKKPDMHTSGMQARTATGCASVYSSRRRLEPDRVIVFCLLEMMGIDIRQAVPTDAPAACRLLRRSIAEGCGPDHVDNPGILDAWLGNKTPENVATWLGTPSNYAVVAERDGELLGLALLTAAGKVALCYVQPEAVRRGVGRAMLDGLERQARAWDIGKLHLQSPPSSSAFFERQGYTNAGKEKACFGLECDLLWKSLKTGLCADPAQSKRFCNCSGK
jgi:putative acetyltransferase